MKLITKIFTESLLNWYQQHGRKNLPWQTPYDPYRVWISEIMLQQTQVKTVIPYFLNFMTLFPNLHTLAAAPLDAILAAWSGLGYYSRARNLHRTAQEIVEKFQGNFPNDLCQLQSLPGIGRSTAAAIVSLAFQQPAAILDGNVKRVLSRYFMLKGCDKIYENQLWELAKACMPNTQCRDYTQAIMDFGALLCTKNKPSCSFCPLKTQCQAFNQHVVHEYPQPKPKKTRPIRKEQFLILYTQDKHIYLEQRPMQGIWGGLWCMPVINDNVDIVTYLYDTYSLQSCSIFPLMQYKHSFTHFHLNISVFAIPIKLIETLPGNWCKANEIQNLGVPKPVNDILDFFNRNVFTPNSRLLFPESS